MRSSFSAVQRLSSLELSKPFDSMSSSSFAFVNQVIGILLLAGAGYCLVKTGLSSKQRAAEAEEIEAKYSKRIQEGCSEIDLAINQWKSAKEAAAERSDLLKLDKVA